MTFNVPIKQTIDLTYDIEIGRNLFGKLIEDIKQGLIKNVSKYAIITDSNCKSLYGDKLEKQLIEQGISAQLFSFPAGEENKRRSTKAALEDQLIENSFGRDTCIIALGGGVVTDLAGYLAATYCRGVPLINYATTVLAAADASIGGKTAVDTKAATNYIGVFKQPNKIYLDMETWQTLPVRQIKAGLVETIKHGCILDGEFFEYLEKNIHKIISHEGEAVLDKEVCEYITFKNCDIKYSVVKEDEKESNYRQVLNLGHTIGRALEPLTNYELNHGEAVAIGLVCQAQMSTMMGIMSHGETQRIIDLLKSIGLPTEIPSAIATEELLEKLHTDKKSRNNRVRFVIEESLGSIKKADDGNFSIEFEDEQLLEFIKKMRG